MMKPLIKYTGGKYREYVDLKRYLPQTINNYFEPFCGGCGVFFQLHNENRIQGKSHINDFSKSLMEFYKSINDIEFRDEMLRLSQAWRDIKKFGDKLYETYHYRFQFMMDTKTEEKFVSDEMLYYIKNALSTFSYNTHGFSLIDKIVLSLNDKMRRFENKTDVQNVNDEMIYQCITTSICQAFYFIIRDMYNDWNCNGNEEQYTMAERSAHWFFIREFCFCSMYRFDSKGRFNVPYGGHSYNKKGIDIKINAIFDYNTQKLFSDTVMDCDDFEKVINSYEFAENDFMFIDPPYDTTFSEYDNHSFDRTEHERLAECLKQCKCKWMMVIGKTDFIKNLYKDYDIIEFGKTYMYQARGEYDNKHSTHLIIKNY